MKIQTKITVNFLLFLLTTILFLEIVNFYNFQVAYDAELLHHVRDVARLEAGSISIFMEATAQRMGGFASDAKIQSCLQEIALGSNSCVPELNRHLTKTKMPTFAGMVKISVLDKNGIVVASSAEKDIGRDDGATAAFLAGRETPSTIGIEFDGHLGKYVILFSAPVRVQGGNGAVGVVVSKINVEMLEHIIYTKAGLGQSGEVLIATADKDGVVWPIKRKFEEQSIIGRQSAVPMQVALNGTEAVFAKVPDYRGVDVIAASEYIKEGKIGLVAKIDLQEAQAPLSSLARAVQFLTIVSVLLGALLIWAVSRTLASPIKKLSSDVDKITQGDLSITLDKNSGISEIDELAASLDKILASLKLAILRTGASKTDLGLGEALQAKKEVENKYKIIYESSRDAIMTLAPPEWHFNAGNPAAIKMFNTKDEAEFVSLSPSDLSPRLQPDGARSDEKAKKMIMKAMKEGSNFFEWTHKRYNGENFPAMVLLSKTTLDGKDMLLATVRDISNKKAGGKRPQKKRK